MPTLPVYVPEKVYWILAREASRLDMTIGKLCTEILKNYAKYLEERREGNAEKEVQTGR